MSVTGEQLAPAMEAALKALEDAGVPRTHVLLGLTADVADPDGTPYETHVGPTRSTDVATLLSMVGRDLETDARAAAVWLPVPGRSCPECESPRYVLRQRVRTPWLHVFDECLDCGHTTPERKGQG